MLCFLGKLRNQSWSSSLRQENGKKKGKEAGPHSVSSLYGSVLASSLTWLTHVALHLQALIALSSLASLPWLLSQQALHG